VTREVLPPALAREDPERARELLADREVVTDTRPGRWQAHGRDGIRETLDP
jgi:hypothetical protein